MESLICEIVSQPWEKFGNRSSHMHMIFAPSHGEIAHSHYIVGSLCALDISFVGCIQDRHHHQEIACQNPLV